MQQPIHDSDRDNYLRDRGWTVLRFWNTQVKFEMDVVLGSIANHLDAISSSRRPDSNR